MEKEKIARALYAMLKEQYLEKNMLRHRLNFTVRD